MFSGLKQAKQLWRETCAQLCLTLQPHGLEPTRLLSPRDFTGNNTGVGCLPFLSPGDLLNSVIQPTSLVSPALTGGLFTISATWEAQCVVIRGDVTYFKIVSSGNSLAAQWLGLCVSCAGGTSLIPWLGN